MSDKAGDPSVSCGGSAPEPDPPVTEDSPDESHWVKFKFRTTSGEMIEDPEGFKLIHPSGREEKSQLASGEFYRAGVPEGLYRMKFKHISDCSWAGSQYYGEPKIPMTVQAQGFDDGTQVKFRVFRRCQSTATQPLFEATAAVAGGAAQAVWKYEQKLREPPGGEFVFEARIASKHGISGYVTILPFPLDDIWGVQQRLKQLGYDCGSTDGILGPKTKAAVEQFQRDHPPLEVDGIPGRFTQTQLALG